MSLYEAENVTSEVKVDVSTSAEEKQSVSNNNSPAKSSAPNSPTKSSAPSSPVKTVPIEVNVVEEHHSDIDEGEISQTHVEEEEEEVDNEDIERDVSTIPINKEDDIDFLVNQADELIDGHGEATNLGNDDEKDDLDIDEDEDW